MSVIRDLYHRQGLERETVDIILNSWRPSTKAQYMTYINRYISFSMEKCGAFTPTLYTGLSFLTHLVKKGCSFNQIAMARSALSTVIDLKNFNTFGQHPHVKRFMKGLFETRPTLPKYTSVWSVKRVLDFMRRSQNADLSTLALGKKLALLLAIVSGGQRAQTIHGIDALDIKILGNKCVIPIYHTLKHTRPGKHLRPLEFSVFLQEPTLCVVSTLCMYLDRTRPFRKYSKLFLSSQRPYKPVSKDTISRWCKDVLKEAGIDVTRYSSHSTRSASSSYLKSKGVSLARICRAAGWSNERTFRQHYDRDIVQDEDIESILLH